MYVENCRGILAIMLSLRSATTKCDATQLTEPVWIGLLLPRMSS